QATIETLGSSQATIKTLGSSQATIETWDSSQATIETWGSSQATIETWDSKQPLQENITHIGGHAVASDRPELLGRVAAAVLAEPHRLKMDSWHCGTSHCIAGWAETLADIPKGQGRHSAGLILLGREAASHFYDSNKDALAWLKQIDAEMNGPDAATAQN
ncbi:MAG: hypothetical protein AAF687_13880, partial [Pseudomonadota bacterium]